MKTLIVIDMQNDFISGSLGTEEAKAIVPGVASRIREYLDRGDEVIFTRDTHGSDYLETHEGKYLPVNHCVYGTWGWEIPEEIDVPECQHIDKATFGWTRWWRHDFQEIELVGLCTDICVVSNALMLRALFSEIEIEVDPALCAGTTPEMHRAALETMKRCHIKVLGE